MSGKENMELERKMMVATHKKWTSEILDRMSRTKKISKDSFFSAMMRAEGNIKYNMQPHTVNDHEYIQAKYCMSIAIAHPNSEEQSVAYGNRSAFLLHMGKIDECIQDIDRALSMAKTNTLKIKLLCRKVTCLSILNMPTDARKTLNEAKLVLEIGLQQDIKTKRALSKLIDKTQFYLDKCNVTKNLDLNKKTSKECPTKNINSFKTVTLKSNNEYGNHLIATRDIKPGEIIFVEKPYVTTLNLHEAHFYCCHCFTLSWAMIPCDSCSWCMFCSENCKKEAWKKYHDIECETFSITKPNNDDDSFVQTSIRSIILAIREAGSVEKLRATLQLDSKEKNAAKFFKNGKIENNGFQTLIHLPSVVQSYLETKFSIYALKVLLYFVIKTDIFGKKLNPHQCRDITENENVMFIGSLILKLIKIAYNCGVKVLNRGIKQDCGHIFEHPMFDTCWFRGLCIAPISSFINHSCDPNVSRCFTADNNVIIYALQPIKKGTQIFECYGKSFYELPNPMRQKNLNQLYNFLCSCKPCTENWETYHDFRSCLCKYYYKMKTALERDLLKTNESTITNIEETVDADFTPQDISRLSKSIEKAIEDLSQPSFITHKLISTLESAFNRQYGGWQHISDKCMSY